MIKRIQGIGLLLSLTLVLSACTGQEAPANTNEESKPTPVQVDIVKQGSINSAAGITGKLSPSKEVALTPKVAGRIVAMNVELGQYVKQGQVRKSVV